MKGKVKKVVAGAGYDEVFVVYQVEDNKNIEREDRRTDSGSCEKRQARGTRPDGLPLWATGLRLDCEAGD